jgi:RHS repeat-associated protein
VRTSEGTTPAQYTYTGQYSNVSDFGLLFYNARWYDPALGRFTQPDTIIPNAGDPQSWDRYAYVLNNPLRYVDPTGQSSCVGRHYDDGPECARKEGTQLNIEIKIRKYQNECGAGRKAGCEGGSAGMIAYFAVGVLTGGTADYLVMGGAGADAGWAALSLAAAVCARNPTCWRVAVGLGILGGYPSDQGFAASPTTTTLEAGRIITRYGISTGSYASPIGTTAAQRALPPGTEDALTIRGFEVVKQIDNVWSGVARGWFGQPGGGTQYFFGAGRTIQSLIDTGHLFELP